MPAIDQSQIISLLAAPALAALLIGLGTSPTFAGEIEGHPRVLDGDTVRFDGHPAMRLWGIDAPEKLQENGPESLAYLERIINDRQLRCTWDRIDRYKRPIVVCYPRTKSGKSWSKVPVNKTMVRLGMAAAYLTYSKEYANDMHIAMKACRRMWSELPHCWRRAQRAGR